MNTQVLRDFNEHIDEGGFDLQAGQTWIYPTNYPIRDYQFNIVSESLYKNTLVSLPTGLGKTFIAAVVMFNYYRWYPSGKIIFMAPTKPLVKQQMEACYNIMAIPKNVTAELTGTKVQLSRKEIWTNKRVFFITPQVLQNDLRVLTKLGQEIKCIVIDEAHKAKGNHAYCEVLHQISTTNKHFRILALSATPGNTMNDISEIIENLLISHLEIRTDDSPDVMPYIYQRTIETFVIPLGEKLQSVKNAYLKILERYTRILVEHGVVHGNCANLTKGRIFMIQKDFQEKNKHTKVKAYGDIMRSLNLCITLYHGYELLIRHGLRQFLNFFKEHSDQVLLRGNVELENIMMDVQEYLGPPPCTDILPDGTIPELSPLTKFGHPKCYKLLDLLLTYFTNEDNASSKVIIFTEYRDSVKEIFGLLIHQRPTIKPKFFLGQASITQKQQIAAIKSFRSGECNTLISTCIGEEGLDIGEVDLIVIFDISNKSPVRMVQRIGRTGRKREGKIFVLVTEGKEQEILKECMINKHYLSKNISKSKNLQFNFFQQNPRMIPDFITPTCQKIHISVPTISKTKTGDIKDMFNGVASNSKQSFLNQFDDIEVVEAKDRIPVTVMLWQKVGSMMDTRQERDEILFSKRLESLRVSQPTSIIGHSTNCDILTSLLQFADSKRYNIPTTQIRANEVASVANKKGKFGRHASSDNFKQSDIRSMFLKSQSVLTQANRAENLKDNGNIDLFKSSTNNLINELHNEISTYLSISCLEDSNCKICDNLFVCYRTTRKDCDFKLDSWIPPDLAIMDEVNLANILSFEKQFQPVEMEMLDNSDSDVFAQFSSKDWDEFNSTFADNIDKTHVFPFEAPESARKVLNIRIGKHEVNAEGKLPSPEDVKDVLTFLKLSEASDIFIGDSNNEKQIDQESLQKIDESFTCAKSNNYDTSPILNKTNCSKGFKNTNRKLFSIDEKLPTIAEVSSPKHLESTPNKSKPKLSNLRNQSCVRKSNFFKSNTECPSNHNGKNLEHRIAPSDTNSNTSNCVSELLTNISDFCDMSIFGLNTLDTAPKNSTQNTIGTKNVDCKETSNSGSEDLFDSCDSPQSDNKNIMCTFNDFSSLNIIPSPIKTKAPVDGLSPVLTNNVKHSQITSKSYNANENEKSKMNSDIDIKEQLSPILGSNKEIRSQKYNNRQYTECDTFNYSDICDLSTFGLPNVAINLDPVNDTKDIKNCSKLDNINMKDLEHSFYPLSGNDLKENKCFSKSLTGNSTAITHKEQQSQDNDPSQVSITQILNIVNGKPKADDSNQTISDVKNVSLLPLQTENNQAKSNQTSSATTTTTTNTTTTNKRRLSIISLSDDDFEQIKCNKTQSGTVQRKKTSLNKKKRKRPVTPVQPDSEEEFEESPFKNNGWISVKKKAESNSSGTIEKPSKKPCKRKKRKRIPTHLIDIEAVLTSSDEAAYGDSHLEAGSSDDVFEVSFVNDNTLDVANTTYMHAKYLQSTRSPLANKAGFKIPELPPLNSEIFSQEVDHGNDTYMNDTFCVDDDMPLSQDRDLSELEIAEMLLKEKIASKKKTVSNDKKKKRAICVSSDSD